MKTTLCCAPRCGHAAGFFLLFCGEPSWERVLHLLVPCCWPGFRTVMLLCHAAGQEPATKAARARGARLALFSWPRSSVSPIASCEKWCINGQNGVSSVVLAGNRKNNNNPSGGVCRMTLFKCGYMVTQLTVALPVHFFRMLFCTAATRLRRFSLRFERLRNQVRFSSFIRC